MARINYPTRFTDCVRLFELIKQKHDADGAASPLIPMLAEQGINMNDDETAVSNALLAHAELLHQSAQAETLRQERNNRIGRIWNEHKDCVRFLKALYTDNTRRLGAWSVEVNHANRIAYPRDFLRRALAVQAFINKHDSYTPPASPLQPYLDINDINLADNLAKLGEAVTFHNDFLAAQGKKETAAAQRTLLFKTVMKHIRAIGQYLVRLYSNNPQEAYKWGFQIDHSPKKPRIRTYILSPGEKKTLVNAVNGGKIVNHGAAVLKIFRGTAAAGTPVVLHPSEEFTIARGFGKFTVINENLMSSGRLTAPFPS